MMTSARRQLLASTIIAGSIVSSPAFAQQQPAESVPQAGQSRNAAPENADTQSSDTIVVTGTLISNPNLTRSTPVNVTTSEELQLRQTNVAEQVLREVPGIVPNVGSAVNNGNGGASFVDLRGLGANRNIVLLDGKRLVPSGLAGQVDLNNIPVALLDRLDVTTGGQVTTYGADAITGVVNFITKRDFAGFELQSSEQITGKGDGNVLRTDITIGANFDDGRGNAVLSVGYQEADPVYQGDRDFSNTNYNSFSPIQALAGSGTTTPSVFTGVVVGAPGTRRQLNPATGLAGAVTAFNFNPFNIFQTPFRRYNIFAEARYKLNDSIEVYSRGLFSKNTVSTIIAPSGVFSSDVTIPLSNPYLPAGLRGQFCAASNRILRPNDPAYVAGSPLTQAQCDAAALATTTTNPNFTTVTTNLRRRTPEVGSRVSNFTTQVFDYRIGVRGDITPTIHYDINGSYGESDRPQTLGGYVLTSRVRAAVFATNTATCLPNPPGGGSTTAGCVPLNLFGATGTITPAQAAYLQASSTTTVRTTLAQVSSTINGDFGVASPAASDPISFAVGGEYRKYSATQSSDLLAQTAGELGGAGGAAPNINGGYQVTEALGELVAPLIQDKPGFKSLTLEAGVRYSTYRIDAPGNPRFSATTYKVGGSYEPFDGLKLRGNYSRAVRAPNIGELFSPLNVGLTNLAVDPCAGAAPTTNANLRAICIAQGAPANSIGNIANPSAGQANSTASGSTNLSPEKADTYTIGGVLQPTFLRGFSVSADYYNIIINNAITAPTPQDAIASCFGTITATSNTNPSCTSIRRDPTTGALDGDPSTTGGLFQPTSNTGRLATDGLDIVFNYRRDLFDSVKLNLAFNGNYTFHSRFKSVPNGINRDCVGFFSVNCSFTGSIQPQFQWTQRTTLGFGGVDVSLLWRHIDKVRQEPLDISTIIAGVDLGNGPAFAGTLGFGDLNGQKVDFGRIPSYDYFDLSGRFQITKDVNFTVTVFNIADRKPPIVGASIGNTAFNSGNTYPSTYDALGRRFAASVRLKF